MKLSPFDIHNHILPGVDDGFGNAADSLEAMKRMVESGCRDFVFTPHLNPEVFPNVDENKLKAAYDSFVPSIPAEWGVKTALAAEYMVVGGFEERIASAPEELLVFPDGSILIEMSYSFRSINLEKVIFELNMVGFRPVLAHPERYTYLAGRTDYFDKLQDIGCRFQLNLLSATGAYGPASLKIMRYLLWHGMYSFVSSDLHSLAQLDRILSYKPGILSGKKLKDLKEIENKLLNLL